MTPQDVAALAALVAIIKEIGTWPLMTTGFAVILGPYIATFILNRAQEKRHADVVQMYRDNVRLVEEYEKAIVRSNQREEVLIDMMRLNTEAQSNLLTWLKQRTRCSDLKGGAHECGT